jgi:excisionase family DNA binding protein
MKKKSLSKDKLKELRNWFDEIPIDSYLTPREIAELLDVHLNTVLYWLQNGNLKGVKIGRRWRVKPEWLREFILGEKN